MVLSWCGFLLEIFVFDGLDLYELVLLFELDSLD